jgi:hypothetical protein
MASDASSAGATGAYLLVNYLDTFKAPEPGYIGGFFNNRLFYYNTPAIPVCKYLLVTALHLTSSQKDL